MNSTSTTAAFDSATASTLFPSLVNLAKLASAPPPPLPASTTDSDTRTAAQIRVDLAKQVRNPPPLPPPNLAHPLPQAAQIRNSLVSLQSQADVLPAADMSIEDQDWLIQQLEAELSKRRFVGCSFAPFSPCLQSTRGADPSSTLVGTTSPRWRISRHKLRAETVRRTQRCKSLDSPLFSFLSRLHTDQLAGRDARETSSQISRRCGVLTRVKTRHHNALALDSTMEDQLVGTSSSLSPLFRLR